MKWDKTGDHRYKCRVSDGDAGRRVVIYRVQDPSIVKGKYTWFMDCEGLCYDEELQGFNETMNHVEAQKEALTLVFDAAIEEIQSLVSLVSKLSMEL